jgi:predicted DNA-binding transcriptional regulator AlpA
MRTNLKNRPALLKECQVAERLNVSVASMRRWRLTGEGPRFRKLNGTGSIRYADEDVEQYIQNSLRRSTSDNGEAV